MSERNHVILEALTSNVKDKLIGTLFGVLLTLTAGGAAVWTHVSSIGHPVMVERVANLTDELAEISAGQDEVRAGQADIRSRMVRMEAQLAILIQRSEIQ